MSWLHTLTRCDGRTGTLDRTQVYGGNIDAVIQSKIRWSNERGPS